MRWVNFYPPCDKDGPYTFAAEIQNFAEQHGYKVPCELDGTRHPGTDCNAKLRTVMRNAGLRKTFGVDSNSVIEVRADVCTHNELWIEKLVEQGIISASYLKHKSIQLYSKSAVDALLSVMLKTEVHYEMDDADKVWYGELPITGAPHNLEKKRNRPKASLFKK